MTEQAATTPTVTAATPIATHGWFIDLGGLWVKYDAIGTIKPSDIETGEGPQPSCLVVLTIPGYKTLRVACSDLALIDAITAVRKRHEIQIGRDRAVGMRS